VALFAGLLAMASTDALPQCTAPDFKLPPATIDVGLRPRDIAVLDIKRDGKLDLVTADSEVTQGSVSFAFGDGTGNLTALVTHPLGANVEPVAVTVADFDLNGFDDVAVANHTQGTLQALLLTSAGAVSVPLPSPIATAPLPTSLVAGDFDRDGVPDLVSVSADPAGTVEFFRGLGDGTFESNAPGSQILVGEQLQDVAAGDFNRDGMLDVAVVAQNLPSNPEVHVVFGDGTGKWLGFNSYPVLLSGLRPIALDVGDVDNDGDLDVVTADSVTSDIVVLLGDGLGNLAAQPPLAGLVWTTSLVLADFDNNGILDLGLAREGTGGVSVLTGDGAGAFATRKDFDFADDAFGLAAGDFDNDGRPDLAGASRPTNKAVLLVNAYDPVCAEPSFARAGRLQPVVNGVTAMVSGDWDGDGIPDLATAGSLAVSILTSDGRLGVSSIVDLPLTPSGSPKSITVADFDLDGDPDLAVTSQTTDVLLFENAGGAFSSAGSLLVGATAYAATSGDFNGDGAPDIVALSRLATSLVFFAGAGDLTFVPTATTGIGLGSLSAIAAGDIDGDGGLDVVVASDSNNLVRWYKGDGAGGFTVGGAGDYPVGSFPGAVAVGDLNGDMRADVAVANALSDDVAVLMNLGGGALGAASFVPVGDVPRSIVIGNANGDGHPDLVVANRDTHDVTILLGDGAGGFPTSRRVPGANSPNVALLFDADRNGRADLAVANWPTSTGGSVAVLPGDGLGDFGPVQIPGGFDGPVEAADFDRDGKPDIVTGDHENPRLLFHRGRGDGTFDPPTSFPTVAIPTRLGVGDLDRDGALDVVVSTGAAVAVMLGDGAGGFTAQPPVFPLPDTAGMVVADFDRDGKLDVAKSDITPGTVTVLFGDGAGGFDPTPFTMPVGGYPSGIVTLDFNRDGILDLAVASATSDRVSVLSGTGGRPTPFFVATNLPTGASSFPTGLTVGDFDHDGIEDLAVAHLGVAPARIGYFRGTGTGFAAQATYPLGDPENVEPDGLAATDFNGDGLLDLLVACRGSSDRDRFSVRVLPGTGMLAGAFGAADVWWIALRQPTGVIVADFDRDAKPDFVARGISFSPSAANTRPVVLNSNCRPRRLFLDPDVSRCNTPSVPFAQQPAIQIEDDGANPIQCDADSVSASIVPGTGTGGATLLGTTSLPPLSGVADWSTAGASQLSIDLPGKKYRLQFKHSFAGLTFSRTFSISPTLAITGPAGYCSVSGGYYFTDPGFDTYSWSVDGSGPLNFAADLTIGPGALLAGPHTVGVDATVDTCSPPTATQPFSVFDDLSNVSVAPLGPYSVCTSCTGATLTVNETDGGAVTRKWGYRTTLGSGPVIYIGGETGPSYLIDGSDFPGQGTYYVLEETTPQCGVPTLSTNEVEVRVTTATASAEEVPVFTVRSTSQLNRLEWIYPSGYGTVAIRYNTSPSWGTCTPPATVASGTADIADQTGTPGTYGSVDHTVSMSLPLVNGTTYCYSMFAQTSPGPPPVYSSLGRPVKGRPFDTSGPVKWAFSVGTSTLEPPGLGAGVLHVVSNDGYLYAMEKGALGGSWPPGFTPFGSTGPSQARPTNVPIAVGPASHVVYLGSQAVAGNNALAVDADTGLGLWGQPLGAAVQGGPGGMFMSYGGSIDAIFFGTWDSSSPNSLFALDPWTGSTLPSWPYTGEAANEIGIISTQPTADYKDSRLFFTSHRYGPGTDVVWCVDLATATRCPLWPVGATSALSDVEASPVLRGTRLYVSPIVGVDGTLVALDANDGSSLWSVPFAPTDGPIKLFVIANVFGTELYLSTTNTVWAITDDGGMWSPKWNVALSGPSQPVFYAGTGRVYLGDGNGRLNVLNANDGLDVVPAIPLGEPGFAVAGAPTVDQAGGFVYLGSDAGVVFAVAIP
jgi:hypothetical protein